MVGLNTEIQYMHGVGEKRAAALAKLGIQTVGQLLYHFPRGYQFRGNVKKLSEAQNGETVSFIVTVTSPCEYSESRRGVSVLRWMAKDDTGKCEIVVFNQDYLRNVLCEGGKYRIFGKVNCDWGKVQMASPAIEPVLPNTPLPNLTAVYPLTASVSSKLISGLMEKAISELVKRPDGTTMLIDNLPEEIRKKYSLCPIDYALVNIHFPSDFAALNAAKRRLIFGELYSFAYEVIGKTSARGKAPRMNPVNMQKFLDCFPFPPTDAQTRALHDIMSDMTGCSSAGSDNIIPAMERLLSGDVGSGKTMVAAGAAYIAVENGYQCAFMVPTEILASQHYSDLEPIFEKLGKQSALLTGSTKAAEKKEILSGLADGKISLVIGTQALLTDNVTWQQLGLVICDEQHRFGVSQRDALSEKSFREENGETFMAHRLTMSATPIPRTLAMFLYGGIAMSILDELPPGRQRVKTYLVNEGYRTRLNAFIRQQHDAGHQVYVVCPAVEETENGEVTQEDIRLFDFDRDGTVSESFAGATPLKSAVAWAAELQSALPDMSVGCVHGRMKPSEKDAIMQDFSSGKLDVLVSTTVIEVGVNVPNATLMIVENAERFGLAQLHQLRGRVGRGSAESFCILVSDSPPDSKAGQRLNVLRSTYNGYKIAEYDLSERGPGDFIRQGEDVKQHGEIRFRLAGLCEDTELLNAALCEAKIAAENAGGKTF